MQRYYYMIQRGGRYALGHTLLLHALITGPSPAQEDDLQRLWLMADDILSSAEQSYLERLLEMAEETPQGPMLPLSETEAKRILEALQKKSTQHKADAPDAPDHTAPPSAPPAYSATTHMTSPLASSAPLPSQGQISFLDAKAQIALPALTTSGTRNHPRIDDWPDPAQAALRATHTTQRPNLPTIGGQYIAPTHTTPQRQGLLQQSLFGRWQRGEMLSLHAENNGDLLLRLTDTDALQRLIQIRSMLHTQDAQASVLCSPVDLLLATVQYQPPYPTQPTQSYFVYQPIHLYRRLFGSWLPDDSAHEVHAVLNEQIDAEECFLCLGRPFQSRKTNLPRGEMGSYRGEITRSWVIPLLQDPSTDLFEKLLRDAQVRCPLYDQDLGALGEMDFYFRLLQQLGLSPRLILEEIEDIIPFDSLCRLLEVDRPTFYHDSDVDEASSPFARDQDDDF